MHAEEGRKKKRCKGEEGEKRDVKEKLMRGPFRGGFGDWPPATRISDHCLGLTGRRKGGGEEGEAVVN